MSVTAEPPGGVSVTGRVKTVGRVVDPATQTVLVRAVVANAGGALRVGQLLPARIVSAPPSGSALVLPAAAATRSGGDLFVFVRDGGSVAARRVNVLADNGASLFIADGVDSNAPVAIEGISALKALWLAGEDEGS
jgi:multidrug efflux pump subunit AcrA (membrane-fusion protein)